MDIQHSSSNKFTKNAGSDETVLQHTEHFAEVAEGSSTRIGMDTGRSLHDGILEGNILDRNQQVFVSSDVTE